MADETMDVPFVEMSFHGPRFDGPGIPVDALAELVAYRELLIEVAKHLYRRSHPGQPLPEGFADRCDLRLRYIERGPSQPTLP